MESLNVNQNIRFLLPTSYWGSMLYYSVVYFYPHHIIEQENYQKKSCRNRCKILGANGVLTLSVPLTKGKNSQQAIKAVRIFNDEPWKTQHFKTIQSQYGKSPYYDFYISEIEALYSDATHLWELNQSIHQWIINRFFLKEALEPFTLEHEDAIDLRMLDFLSQEMVLKKYHQVFDHKYPFINNLSILDGIFNLGPELRMYFEKSLLKAIIPVLTE